MTVTPLQDTERLFRLRAACADGSPIDPTEQAARVAFHVRRALTRQHAGAVRALVDITRESLDAERELETERLDVLERLLDALPHDPEGRYALPIPARRRAWWRRRAIARAQERGFELYVRYKPNRGNPYLELFVLPEEA